MNKMLVFDMDGTIYDLYNVENWLEGLRSEKTEPYSIGKPIYNMEELNKVVAALKDKGYTIAVTTWGSKNATKEYNKAVSETKLAWLKKVHFPFDLFNFQPYGTNKRLATCAIGGTQILIDDNESVRKDWGEGETIDATKNILEILKKILDN